jgi:hypothetical protein
MKHKGLVLGPEAGNDPSQAKASRAKMSGAPELEAPLDCLRLQACYAMLRPENVDRRAWVSRHAIVLGIVIVGVDVGRTGEAQIEQGESG